MSKHNNLIAKSLVAGLLAIGAAATVTAAQAADNCVAFELCDTRLDVSHSDRTREEVQAEAIAARKAGTLVENDRVSFPEPIGQPTVTRAEIRDSATQAARKPINIFYPG